MKTCILLSLILISFQSFACDNCNVYMGLSPNDDKNMAGVYYRSRLMMGAYNFYGLQTMQKHAAHGNDPAFWGNQVSEYFNTIELRGEFLIKKRWRTTVIVPYVINTQTLDETRRYLIQGMADPIVLQGYQLLNPYKLCTKDDVVQRLEIGGGLKVPVGAINKEVNGLYPNLDLQPGSGSLDGLIYAKYIFKYKGFGVAANTNFKFNGKNKDPYRYGNTFNSTINFFYQTKIKETTFMPMIGVNLERAAFDESTEVHYDTGGSAYFAQLGLKVFLKNFVIFGEFQKAISNQMNGYSQLINKQKLNLGLAYKF
ncbi:MAG: hypothetical protein ABJG68_11485 [Crocinitomicaceae bacterium]